MKKLFTLGLSTALLTASLMGSAAFADANLDNNLLNNQLDNNEFEIGFRDADDLLKANDSKGLMSKSPITANEIFTFYGDKITATNKSKIETLTATLEEYRAAGDVINYEKTSEEIETLLPQNLNDDNFIHDEMNIQNKAKIKTIFSAEDFALYEKYEKELELTVSTNNAVERKAVFTKMKTLFVKYEAELLKTKKAYTAEEILSMSSATISTENKSKIETLAKQLEEYRVNGDLINYEKTFDEIELLLPNYNDNDNDNGTDNDSGIDNDGDSDELDHLLFN